MIQKTASVVTQAGGGTAFASGASYVLGLTPAQWSVVGVIGGLVIGLLGLVINAYFQWKRLDMEKRNEVGR